MPNENEAFDANTVKDLEAARSILDGLIAKLGGKKSPPRASSRVSVAPADGLPGHIVRLRDEGHFKSPKTAKEVQEKLQPVYACDVDRVAMALLRLLRKKAIRKTSKTVGKRKQVAYVW